MPFDKINNFYTWRLFKVRDTLIEDYMVASQSLFVLSNLYLYIVAYKYADF